MLCCCCCRFGAEDLFAAAEDGSAERSRRLLEEDIDDILLRSEVVSQQLQPGQQSVAGGASDLLSSFNVATFKVCSALLRRHSTSAYLTCTCLVKAHALCGQARRGQLLDPAPTCVCTHVRQSNQPCMGLMSGLLLSLVPQNEEDDATFWSRLISEPDRPQDELNAPLGPRAARTKQQQQEADGAAKSASRSPPGSRQPSSQQLRDESPPPGGAGGSRPKAKKARRLGGGAGRSSRGSDKPVAPVEGAVLRIDAWPLEPTQDGKVGYTGGRCERRLPCD